MCTLTNNRQQTGTVFDGLELKVGCVVPMSAYEDVASGNGTVDVIGVVPVVADGVIAGSAKHTSNKQVKI